MSVHIHFRAGAREEAVAIDRWWRTHRPAAPTLFVDELEQTLSLLRAQPLAGRVTRDDQGLVQVRRIFMRRTHHHLYYRFDGAVLDVLAIWHSARRGPPASVRR